MTLSYASLPQMNMTFSGAKLAIISEGCVLTILRDDIPNIPYPGYWDMPGGGREGSENPVACVLRETHEELGLTLSGDWIEWGQCYGEDHSRTWFFGMTLSAVLLPRVTLGREGQAWQAMPVSEFLDHPRAVPHFQRRLKHYLTAKRMLEKNKEKPPASWGGGR